MLEALLFSMQVTLPNVALMALGWWLKRTSQIDNHFCEQASQLVFNYSLPCLLFFSLLKTNVDYKAQLSLILAGVIVTMLLFIGAEIYARYFIDNPRNRGVFVQGVFRGNTALVGLAMIANAYGDEGVGMGAVLAGALTLLFNVLAVITLTIPDKTNATHNLWHTLTPIFKKIISNPLIIAIILAIIIKELPFTIPEMVNKTGNLLSGIALPLALICAGATFKLDSMFKLSGVSLQSSIGRLVIAPILTVFIGLLFGFSGMDMGVLFLISATPVAAASYVMARSMGGNDVIAANILGFTTFASMFSAGFGVVILRHLEMM